MINKILILFGVFTILLCAGCSVTKDNPPTNHNMICSDLENKLVFPDASSNLNVDWSSATKQAEAMREYRKYDCDNKD
jgi:hypothetical protein